jgi:MscS family membrane protein
MALESRKALYYQVPTLRKAGACAILCARNALLLAVFSLSLAAQIPSLLKPQPKPADQQEQVVDPLGRSAPRGTIAGFIRAIHRDDLVAATSYMQLTPHQKPKAEVLARDLSELMDRYFIEPIAQISDSPAGALDDGLPPDREKVGPLKMRSKAVDIILVHVTDSVSGQIWLISSDTLETVPALHSAMEETWLDRVMPKALLENTLFDISIAQLLLWVASLVVPLLLLWSFFRLSAHLLLSAAPSALRARLEFWNGRLRWPAIAVLTLIIHGASVFFLGFSLSFRIRYTRFVSIALVAALAWTLHRITFLLVEQARVLTRGKGQSGSESLILLGRRVFNALLAIVAIFIILTIAGVDTKTALAGVGIGGVAVAFGAQKSVENLLGGIFLLTDKALAIGDTCSISNRVGTVEDITLRSVRIRTVEQTLLSVPAGVLSQANIENFATRNKILVRTNLQLGYKTTATQLKSVLSGIESLLAANPEIEQETAYIRLVDFSPQAIELELFAYVLTSSWPKFLAVREALLLDIAEVVESAGSRFAGPTHFVHLEQAPERDFENTREMQLRATPSAVADDHNADSIEPIREAQKVRTRFA